jgi:hypothetical protein
MAVNGYGWAFKGKGKNLELSQISNGSQFHLFISLI